MVDNRLGGKDFAEEDIIQLRQICRTSGVCVSIDITNTRDSLYRAAVELVLNVCCRTSSQSTDVQIDGEDARQFLAGLAENIGLDNIRASRMASAGVAARTRFCFLQAWAFEMQGKRTEAVSELSKICLLHSIFPPGESSPEMEMVAQGLEKILKVEQRELLMTMVVAFCNCSEEIRKSTAESLGSNLAQWANSATDSGKATSLLLNTYYHMIRSLYLLVWAFLQTACGLNNTGGSSTGVHTGSCSYLILVRKRHPFHSYPTAWMLRTAIEIYGNLCR